MIGGHGSARGTPPPQPPLAYLVSLSLSLSLSALAVSSRCEFVFFSTNSRLVFPSCIALFSIASTFVDSCLPGIGKACPEH